MVSANTVCLTTADHFKLPIQNIQLEERSTWSLNTVSPSLSVSWNQSRHVTRLPVQLWKLQAEARAGSRVFESTQFGTHQLQKSILQDSDEGMRREAARS